MEEFGRKNKLGQIAFMMRGAQGKPIVNRKFAWEKCTKKKTVVLPEPEEAGKIKGEIRNEADRTDNA